MNNENKSLMTLQDDFNLKDISNPEFLKYYKEIMMVSKRYGLGDNITIETIYDGNIPEKVFTINLNHAKLTDDDFYYHEQILDYMDDFAKKNNIEDFAKDTYIVLG
ncbi:MAG: hypothetical protein HUK28_05115 [Methanobrevibacter sp.]|nr:hypothetical protein [Methanobrevibacter sp.]